MAKMTFRVEDFLIRVKNIRGRNCKLRIPPISMLIAIRPLQETCYVSSIGVISLPSTDSYLLGPVCRGGFNGVAY